MTTLGDQIKKLRLEKKLTQVQLANKLELDQTTVSSYEKNKRLPDIGTLGKLATAFDVSLDELVYARNLAAHGFTQEQGRVVREVNDKYTTITPKDLKDKFNLVVDDRPATDDEIEEAIKYIKIQRMMKNQND